MNRVEQRYKEALEKCVNSGQAFFDWWKEFSACPVCGTEYEGENEGEDAVHETGCAAVMLINSTMDARIDLQVVEEKMVEP